MGEGCFSDGREEGGRLVVTKRFRLAHFRGVGEGLGFLIGLYKDIK